MSLRISPVDTSTLEAFVAYAVSHGPEHDESYVQPGDLASFDPADEPSALATGDDGRAVGAASLLVDGYADEGMARFRVLHAADPTAYADLVASVVSRAPARVRHAFAFFPDDPALADVLLTLGFEETRRAYILRRQAPPAEVPDPPEGVSLRVADPDLDGAAWSAVLNDAFCGLPGRFDMTPDRARSELSGERVLPGGALMAWRDRRPIGAVLVVAEPDEDGASLASVETLAIVSEEQRAGLGRLLLRRGIALAADAGYARVDLSTNELNERALALYRSEGFRVVDVRVCWTLERG